MSILRFSRICLLALALSSLCGCPQNPQAGLPSDPGLQQEDFGSGLSLGLSHSDAAAKAQAAPKGLLVEVLTREELVWQEAPPAAEAELDKLVLICEAQGAGDPAPSAVDPVIEMRAYLAPQANSVLTILGQPAAALDPGAAENLLGKPLRSEADAAGNQHRIWSFASTVNKSDTILLTLSFSHSGYCYAIAIKLVQPT